MKSKHLIPALFILLAIIQVAVPVKMIFDREITLKTGQRFKFHTAPVDPYDAFRGRYVAVGIESSAVPAVGVIGLKRGQKVYAHIAVDEQGFAAFSKVTARPPEGNAYVKTRVNFVIDEPSGTKVYFKAPFDRYYMEEKDAPAAEDAYRTYGINPERPRAYVTVRVKNGLAVLEELYIDGKPIRQFLRENGRNPGL
ncbi:MAG: GDYXXLXY domain-containing protein [Bacillota bacterium]